MNPKIAIGSWAFAFGPFASSPWSLTQILQYAQDAGFKGIEINGFAPHPTPESHPTRESRLELLREIESYGLGISGYAPDFTSIPPAIVDEERYLERLRDYIDFSRDLGITTIRVDTVSPPEYLDEEKYEERFQRLAKTWRASGTLAYEAGMQIVWEFEPGFWLNKPSEVKRMVEKVNHPAFQVLFDTSHAYMSGVVGARQVGKKELLSGGITEYARLLSKHIGHFHLIDSDGTLHDEETSTHAAFGAGHIDFREILAELKPIIGNMEWWCVDFCFNAEVEEWGRQSVSFIQEQIREVD